MRAWLPIICCLGLLLHAPAQCPELATPATPSGDFLTSRQEGELGQIMAAQAAGYLPEFTAPNLLGHLRQVAAKLIVALPPTDYRFHIHLLDVPYADAFTLPGGEIYITRPMVNLLASDDELAGVLAHEMGHVMTRQLGLRFSRALQRNLGVRQVGDQSDLLAQYNRLFTLSERPGIGGVLQLGNGSASEDAGQDAADQFAIVLLAHAGYSPEAFPRAFDRLADLRGQAANWLSDFLQTAPPDQRRLRAARAEADRMARLCPVAPAADTIAFAAWKAAVVAAQRPLPAKLPGLLRQQALTPPLQAGFRRLRFSPDGSRVLVDADGVWVIRRQPWAVELHIAEPDALDPEFTPDSSGVVFHTAAMRVERWDIAARSRVRLTQIPVPIQGCVSSYLTPAGDRLACLRSDRTFELFDATSGALLLRRTGLPRVSLQLAVLSLVLARLDLGQWLMAASPDGRYLIVVTGWGQGFGVDLRAASFVALPGELRSLVNPLLRFASDHTMVATKDPTLRKWELAAFPSGAPIRQTVFLDAKVVQPETHGDDWIVRPAGNRAVAVVNPATGKYLLGANDPAMDGYDDLFVAQGAGGSVDLVQAEAGSFKQLQSLVLPASSLSFLSAVAVSPDLSRLALAAGKVGAIWNLADRQRDFALRRFNGAWLQNDRAWLEFPAYRKMPATLALLDLATKQAQSGAAQPATERVTQFGPYVATLTPAPGGWQRGSSLVIMDVRSRQVVYSRKFARRTPPFEVSPGGRVWFAWPADLDGLDRELGADFKRQLLAAKDRSRAVWVEVADFGGGKTLEAMLDPAPRIELQDSFVVGDRLFFADGADRVFAYDLPSGRLAGVCFGVPAAASESTHWMAVLRGPYHLQILNTQSLEVTGNLVFPNRINVVRFSADGRQLLVVTGDQTVYTLAVSAPRPSPAPSTAKLQPAHAPGA